MKKAADPAGRSGGAKPHGQSGGSKPHSGSGGSKPPGRSVRTLKVGESMRHVLAEVLARGDIADPVLERQIISISEVRVSPDLRHATVFIMPVGGTDADHQLVLKALGAQSRQLRQEVARRVNTKYAADLHFRIDESFAEAARIDSLLRQPAVARDLDERVLPKIADQED